MTYEVIVGNIGRVYGGEDETLARDTFTEYVEQSKMRAGRASGEFVAFFHNGEMIDEHCAAFTSPTTRKHA